MYRDKAIYNLYPAVENIIESIDARDANNNSVQFDEALIAVEFDRLTQEAEVAKVANKAIDDTQTTLDSLTADYPQFEKDTFWIQELEARAYIADELAVTPFIDGLCTARGIYKVDMVAKIIANADALKMASASIVGAYQASIEV